MTSSLEMVREFHAKMGAPIAPSLRVLSDDRIKLRLKLIAEEFCELVAAAGCNSDAVAAVLNAHDAICRCTIPYAMNLVDVADALADIKYVVDGCAVEMGIPLDAVTVEVHRSNMTKEPGNMRPDGKILKGPSYSPPDIAKVIGVGQ